MCLTHQTAEKDPRQGSPLSTWKGRAKEKAWPKRLIASYQRLEKRLWKGHNSCRGSPCPYTLGTTRVPTSQATVPPSCSTLTKAKLPQGKKCLVSMHPRSLWSCLTLCDPNGNLLQYSCLQNPVDSGTWRAAVHMVAQSRTQPKQLSMHECAGEGNGNPLQYSCLENPRDRAAWWAAICGVAQNRTRLKRPSSSSRLWPARLLCQGGGFSRQ